MERITPEAKAAITVLGASSTAMQRSGIPYSDDVLPASQTLLGLYRPHLSHRWDEAEKIMSGAPSGTFLFLAPLVSMKTFDDGLAKTPNGPTARSRNWRVRWRSGMSRFCFGSIQGPVMCRRSSLLATRDFGIPGRGARAYAAASTLCERFERGSSLSCFAFT